MTYHVNISNQYDIIINYHLSFVIYQWGDGSWVVGREKGAASGHGRAHLAKSPGRS